MSASYPYLAIAKAYNVDYGLVLSYADTLDKTARGQVTDPTYWETKAATELPREVQTMILGIWRMEQRRQRAVRC